MNHDGKNSKRKNSEITILFAEDEAAVRNMLQRALEMNGFSLLVAVDGEEALRLASEHSEDIDLLLSNVRCPVCQARISQGRCGAPDQIFES